MNTDQSFISCKNNVNVPIIKPVDLELPAHLIDFEPACGAGDGFLNDIVPEKVWGIPISPACFVHDYMWKISEASWGDFHYSNDVFLVNITSLLRHQSKSNLLYHFRLYRMITYFNAVDTIGSVIFWHMKRK